jgi:hypothetical protein
MPAPRRDPDNPPRRIRREADGSWSVTVWWGHHGIVSHVQRYFYNSRAAARASDIGDTIGKRGRVR